MKFSPRLEKIIDESGADIRHTCEAVRRVLSKAHVNRKLRKWPCYEITYECFLNMLRPAIDDYKYARHLVENFPVVAAGGIFARHLSGQLWGSNNVDMDFFFVKDNREYNPTETLANIVEYITQKAHEDGHIVKCVRNARCTTVMIFSRQYAPYEDHPVNSKDPIWNGDSDRNIVITKEYTYQFIHRIYPSAMSVVGGFDISASMILYGIVRSNRRVNAEIISDTGTRIKRISRKPKSTPEFYTNDLGADYVLRSRVIVDISRQSKSMLARLAKYEYMATIHYPSDPCRSWKRNLHELGSLYDYLPKCIVDCPIDTDRRDRFIVHMTKEKDTTNIHTWENMLHLDVYDYTTDNNPANSFHMIKSAILGDVGAIACVGDFRKGLINPQIPIKTIDFETSCKALTKYKHGHKMEILKRLAESNPGVFESSIASARESLQRIDWMTDNPWTQWTSSFRPMNNDPERIYGWKPQPGDLMEICIPQAVETTIRLGRRDPDSPLSILTKDALNRILTAVAYLYFD